MPEKTLTPKRKVGRTSGFNEALAAKICDLIREGYSERAIAKMKGMPTARTMHPNFSANIRNAPQLAD